MNTRGRANVHKYIKKNKTQKTRGFCKKKLIKLGPLKQTPLCLLITVTLRFLGAAHLLGACTPPSEQLPAPDRPLFSPMRLDQLAYLTCGHSALKTLAARHEYRALRQVLKAPALSSLKPFTRLASYKDGILCVLPSQGRPCAASWDNNNPDNNDVRAMLENLHTIDCRYTQNDRCADAICAQFVQLYTFYIQHPIRPKSIEILLPKKHAYILLDLVFYIPRSCDQLTVSVIDPSGCVDDSGISAFFWGFTKVTPLLQGVRQYLGPPETAMFYVPPQRLWLREATPDGWITYAREGTQERLYFSLYPKPGNPEDGPTRGPFMLNEFLTGENPLKDIERTLKQLAQAPQTPAPPREPLWSFSQWPLMWPV